MDELELADLFNIGRFVGPMGLAMWLFLKLLHRGDDRVRDALGLQEQNIRELRAQRDYAYRELSDERASHARTRAENARLIREMDAINGLSKKDVGEES